MLCIYFIKLYVINSQNNPLTGIIHWGLGYNEYI